MIAVPISNMLCLILIFTTPEQVGDFLKPN